MVESKQGFGIYLRFCLNSETEHEDRRYSSGIP